MNMKLPRHAKPSGVREGRCAQRPGSLQDRLGIEGNAPPLGKAIAVLMILGLPFITQGFPASWKSGPPEERRGFVIGIESNSLIWSPQGSQGRVQHLTEIEQIEEFRILDFDEWTKLPQQWEPIMGKLGDRFHPDTENRLRLWLQNQILQGEANLILPLFESWKERQELTQPFLILEIKATLMAGFEERGKVLIENYLTERRHPIPDEDILQSLEMLLLDKEQLLDAQLVNAALIGWGYSEASRPPPETTLPCNHSS